MSNLTSCLSYTGKQPVMHRNDNPCNYLFNQANGRGKDRINVQVSLILTYDRVGSTPSHQPMDVMPLVTWNWQNWLPWMPCHFRKIRKIFYLEEITFQLSRACDIYSRALSASFVRLCKISYLNQQNNGFAFYFFCRWAKKVFRNNILAWSTKNFGLVRYSHLSRDSFSLQGKKVFLWSNNAVLKLCRSILRNLSKVA